MVLRDISQCHPPNRYSESELGARVQPLVLKAGHNVALVGKALSRVFTSHSLTALSSWPLILRPAGYNAVRATLIPTFPRDREPVRLGRGRGWERLHFVVFARPRM
jgi:hypothetical protein